MTEWQPIETAPRDGTVVLAWRFYAVAIRWNAQRKDEFPWDAVHLGGHIPMLDNGFQDADPHLTHWMPLPAPPEE